MTFAWHRCRHYWWQILLLRLVCFEIYCYVILHCWMWFLPSKKKGRKFRHCYKPSWLTFPYAAPAAELHLLKLEDARGFSPCDGLSNRILVFHFSNENFFLQGVNQMATKVDYTMNSGRRSLILSSCQNVLWLFSLSLQSFPSSRWFPSDPIIGRIVLKSARNLTLEGSRYPHHGLKTKWQITSRIE